ncbi:hypothetical protein BDN72DRAFT_776736 [Pluteus cervinus]|uniref:Uncharacterized protein n=1 Tax=Pluteus cervinus TaxID=181527 RepID=A0ACD3AAW4_9AGAR|nr:hypothetical protein BDN72DRAFT_776736 [Pluteus cervinus]
MESLNLNTLATSLPSGQQKAEAELLNNFKSAALSITTLYRSSRQASKRAYNAGYASACQDLLTMIQQGVSVSGLSTSEENSTIGGGGMTIGKVMDWTEARLEEIKAREEEEDEDEEREKEKERRPTTGASSNAPAATVAARGASSHATTATPAASAKRSKGSSPFTTVKSKEQVCPYRII